MEKGIVLEDTGYEAEYQCVEDGIGSMGLEAGYELHLKHSGLQHMYALRPNHSMNRLLHTHKIPGSFIQ